MRKHPAGRDRADEVAARAFIGDEARQLLGDQGFRAQWEELHRSCEWSTVFQSPGFALVWYDVYRADHAPVVAVARSPSGRLEGLLLLALTARTRELVHVGAHHAEYHTWLGRSASDAPVVAGLLRAARAIAEADRLLFLFLAPGTPVEALPGAADRDLPTVVRWHRRGLMRVGPGSAVEQSLRKSANRSRLSRLGRVGPVRLEQLHTRAELEAVIDAIAVQCDVRQGGAHASLPFGSDPRKREFHLALMDVPGLAHVTVLRAGETIVASHASVVDRRAVPLGLITHAPHLAAYSPGKLLLLLLGRLLGEQGYTTFDLTPGGTYKDRFATEFDDVAVAEVFFTRRALQAYRARAYAVRQGRRLGRLMGVNPDEGIRTSAALVRRVLRLRPRRVLQVVMTHGSAWLGSTREFRFYTAPAVAARGQSQSRIRANNLDDLLRYRPRLASDQSLTEFLATALRRLEEGQVVFTYAENGILLHYSWLIPSTTQVGSDYGHTVPVTPSAVLWDDFTAPEARGRGLHQESIRVRLEWVMTSGCAPRAVIGVRGDNGPSRHNIEKSGFSHVASAWLACRLGRQRRWLTTAPDGRPWQAGDAADPAF